MHGNQTCLETNTFSFNNPALLEPRWYAIHTRARHEKAVSAHLAERGIQSFLPLVSSVRRWSDRRKVVHVPLFSCYTFVHMPFTEELFNIVRQAQGTLGFVGVNGVGTPIPDKQIEDIRTLLASNAPYELHPCLTVGRRVRIRGGSLDGVEGILVAKHAGRSVVVSVEIVQRAVAVRVEGYDIEPV